MFPRLDTLTAVGPRLPGYVCVCKQRNAVPAVVKSAQAASLSADGRAGGWVVNAGLTIGFNKNTAH